jgi:hypothetical protein
MALTSLTPEGKVTLVLSHGRHTYKELKMETGLSDRWLTVKLRELEGKRVIKKDGRWYGLAKKLDFSAYELTLYMFKPNGWLIHSQKCLLLRRFFFLVE